MVELASRIHLDPSVLVGKPVIGCSVGRLKNIRGYPMTLSLSAHAAKAVS
jgi:hypothetical protein